MVKRKVNRRENPDSDSVVEVDSSSYEDLSDNESSSSSSSSSSYDYKEIKVNNLLAISIFIFKFIYTYVLFCIYRKKFLYGSTLSLKILM